MTDTAEAFVGMKVEEAFALFDAHPEQKLWAYVRVSSKGQESDGYGLEAQMDAVRAYETEHGAKVIALLENASASRPLVKTQLVAAKPGEPEEAPRPVLQALLSHLCRQGEGATLLLYKLDRLSRVASDQDILLELLRRRGVRVISLQGSEADLLDGSDPTRDLMRRILGAFAQYEKAIIFMRTENGRRAKALRGGYAGGRPPFGYCSAGDGELHVEEREAEQIRIVWYLRHMEVMSFTSIIGFLERRGYLDWNRMRVSRVLKNRDLYTGIYIDPFGTKHDRPDLRIIPDNVEDLDRPEGLRHGRQ